MGEAFDPYVIPGTNVLKNMVEAATWEDLEQRENDLVFARMSRLAGKPPKIDGIFKQIQDIHKFLFGRIYEWAGELRTIDMRKGDGPLFQLRFTSTAIQYFEKTLGENGMLKRNGQGYVRKEAGRKLRQSGHDSPVP
ncbi:hypothetical protein [uncultured Bifidobacterium sp.]|uniref:hypothetical protein n=1 Tax=uncultured Bifidobacterium sp. TaxID=165187 RepID=UPI0025D55E94|nr:hypothetical protein [uncultured Bifidobacterium sp.]